MSTTKKKKSTGSRSKGASVPNGRSRRRNNSSGFGQTYSGQPQSLSLPQAMATTNSQSFNVKFGMAAPHDEFPSGGVRIAGCLNNVYNDQLWNTGSGAHSGLWYATSAANSGVVLLISPTAYGISSITSPQMTMFGQAGSASSYMHSVAQYFPRFRFRKLRMKYVPYVASTNVGTFAIGYQRDTNLAYTNSTTGMQMASIPAQRNFRLSSWTPGECLLIDEKTSTKSDELFFTTAGGDGMTLASQSASVLNQYFQGGIFAVQSINDSTQQPWGAYLWDFVLDLYGFSQQPAISLSLQQQMREDDLKMVCARNADADKSREQSSSVVALRQRPSEGPSGDEKAREMKKNVPDLDEMDTVLVAMASSDSPQQLAEYDKLRMKELLQARGLATPTLARQTGQSKS